MAKPRVSGPVGLPLFQAGASSRAAICAVHSNLSKEVDCGEPTIGVPRSMKSGYASIHSNVCMPPMAMPITAHTWELDSHSERNRCSDYTMSRIVKTGNFISGCFLLFDGAEETPFPIASTNTTK